MEHAESYKHLVAKELLCKWLTTAGQIGVLEYPVCELQRHNSILRAWHLTDYEYPCDSNGEYGTCPEDCGPTRVNRTCAPGRLWCLTHGLVPLVIFDVVVIYDGRLIAGYEVVHRGPPSKQKLDRIQEIRIKSGCPFPVYIVSAEDILTQRGIPSTIPYKEILPDGGEMQSSISPAEHRLPLRLPPPETPRPSRLQHIQKKPPLITVREYNEYIRSNPVPMSIQLALFSYFTVYNKQTKVMPWRKDCKMVIADGDTIRTYHAALRVTPEYGLPNSTDQDFYIGLKTMAHYRFQRTGKIENPIRFTKHELFRFMGYEYGSGPMYHEVDRWLNVFTHTTISIVEEHKKGDDIKTNKYRFRVCEYEASVDSSKSDDTDGTHFVIKLSDWYIAEMTSAYTIPIDPERYFRVNAAIAKVLVPMLYALVHFADEGGHLVRDYGELCACLVLTNYRQLNQRKKQFAATIRDLVTEGGFLDKCELDDSGIHFWYSEWMLKLRNERRTQQQLHDLKIGTVVESDQEEEDGTTDEQDFVCDRSLGEPDSHFVSAAPDESDTKQDPVCPFY